VTFGNTEDTRFNSGYHASPICKGLRLSENLAVTMPLGGCHFCAVIRRCQELLLSTAVPARGSQESGLALSVCSSRCGCVGAQLLRDLAPGCPCLTQAFAFWSGSGECCKHSLGPFLCVNKAVSKYTEALKCCQYKIQDAIPGRLSIESSPPWSRKRTLTR